MPDAGNRGNIGNLHKVAQRLRAGEKASDAYYEYGSNESEKMIWGNAEDILKEIYSRLAIEW